MLCMRLARYAVDGALKECVRRTIKRRRLDRLLNLE